MFSLQLNTSNLGLGAVRALSHLSRAERLQVVTKYLSSLVSIVLKLFASYPAMEEYSTSSVLSTYGGGGGLAEFELSIVASATCTFVSYDERV